MTEHRMCTAKGVAGTCIFHSWGQRAYPIGPSPMVGGDQGGQMSYPAAVIECEDGNVLVVEASLIKFVADDQPKKAKDEPTKSEQEALDAMCHRCAVNDDMTISDEEVDIICAECCKRVDGVWALTNYKSREVPKL